MKIKFNDLLKNNQLRGIKIEEMKNAQGGIASHILYGIKLLYGFEPLHGIKAVTLRSMQHNKVKNSLNKQIR